MSVLEGAGQRFSQGTLVTFLCLHFPSPGWVRSLLSQCLWGRADSPPPTVLPSVSDFPKAPQIPAFPRTLGQHDPTTLFCQLYFPCLTSLEKMWTSAWAQRQLSSLLDLCFFLCERGQ